MAEVTEAAEAGETAPAMRYDVVILGGAFAGAAAATLLRREAPQLSVLVVEKAREFDAKVGEATTEMSGMFMTRRLALWQHLEMEQLPKEGLRYWSTNEHVHGHASASETGGFVRSTVPSFQLRRDALDEHVLATAAAEGAEVWRPARALDAQVGRFDHRVTIERGAERIEVGFYRLGHVIVLWSWALTQPNPEATESTTVRFRSLDGRDREIAVPRLTFTEPITTLAGAAS